MSNTRESVDKFITAIPGEWKFDKEVTQYFDSHVRKSVPLYDEAQRIIVELSEWFVRDGSVVYDIGSSTGETISLLLKKHLKKKNVQYIGIDNSISMIKAARKKCDKENVQFLHQDVVDLAEFANADFVISLYTLQFLPLKDRVKVLHRIYENLSAGGVFVMVEKVRAENSFFEDLWLELHWDFKRNQGLSDAMILQKAKSIRGVLVPLTLNENIDLLKQIGFTHIDVFIKWLNFAGIIALKSPRFDAKISEQVNKTRQKTRNLVPKRKVV